MVMLPLLINQTYEQAATRLSGLGLVARRVEPENDCGNQRQLNRVLRQRPEAGELVPLESVVTLVTCPPVIVNINRQVPDLKGLDMAQAKILLRGMDLKLRVGYQSNCTEPFLQNKIVSQHPEPLSTVRRGSLVQVLICRYKP